MESIDQLAARATDQFDLTEANCLASLQALADSLLASPDATPEKIKQAAAMPDAPLEFRLAAKLFLSRQAVMALNQPMTVAVCFAMWGEHARLQPKSAANPMGEDALRVKLDQLQWLFEGTPVHWHLYAVDDGDPQDSGRLAQEIAQDHPLGDQVTIMWLDRHLPAQSGPLQNLANANDSRKGGAIILGADQAIRDGNDAFVYTDADNSVHLGQLGLLLAPFANGARIVLGNRKHDESVLVKEGDRWGQGIKVLRHMQRMIGSAIFELGLNDTQAAFKLYQSDLLQEIIQTPTVFDFSFDTDWIAAAIARKIDFVQVPFAFIDSAAESASAKQNPMTTWETLLQGLAAAMRRHDLLSSDASAAMAQLLEEEIRDHTDLELIIDELPQDLAQVPESELGNPVHMAPSSLQSWIQSLR